MNNYITKIKPTISKSIQTISSSNEKTFNIDELEKTIQTMLSEAKPTHSLEFNVVLSYFFKDKKVEKQLNKEQLNSILTFKYLSGKLHKIHCVFNDAEKQIQLDSKLNLEDLRYMKKKNIHMILSSSMAIQKLKPFSKNLDVKGLMPSAANETVFGSDEEAERYFTNLSSDKYRRTSIAIDSKKKLLNFHGSFASCPLGIEEVMENLQTVVDFILLQLEGKLNCDRVNVLNFYIKTTRGGKPYNVI